MLRKTLCALAVATALASSAHADPRATIVLVNLDAAGVGLNDPTPASPVGGNSGTTIGAQRQNALAFAAQSWANNLRSFVPIRIQVSFTTRTCNATAAVLASAGPITFFSGFSNWQTYPDTFYPLALANKLARTDLDSRNDIQALFNINLGQPGCLTGVPFYYGFDGNEGPSAVDLVATALHEFGHGLGFTQTVNISPTVGNPPQPNPTFGVLPAGLPDVYNRNLFDTTIGKTWPEMTTDERRQSIPNGRKVVWVGPRVTTAVPQTLSFGLPLLFVSSPFSIAGTFDVGPAAFGPPLAAPGVSASVVVATDDANASGPTNTDACTAITNAGVVAGKIALVDRGTCTFVVKVQNLQAAGAIGVLVADNAADSPPAPLGGADPSITIPAARILLVVGTSIKGALTAGETVNATLGVDLTRLAGANEDGFAQVNATNPIVPGSSIAHWDPIASPNLLMEPAINADLDHSPDLTLPLLHDLGWLDEDNRP